MKREITTTITSTKMLAQWIVGWRATHVSLDRANDDNHANRWVLRRNRLRIAYVSDSTMRKANFFYLYSRAHYVDDKKLADFRMRNGL
jgi:hypothetical protein